MPRDLLRVRCTNCDMPGTVTRTLWDRMNIGGCRLACGGCRKTTIWITY
jgi:hypothetical protein